MGSYSHQIQLQGQVRCYVGEGLREEVIVDLVGQHIPPESLTEQWDLVGLQQELQTEFGSQQPLQQWLEEDDNLDESGLIERILQQAESEYATKQAAFETANIDMRLVEKQVMLQVIDARWKEHLATMDMLRQGIHLRGYAQKNPKQEYKRESFELFQNLLFAIKEDVIRILSHVQVRSPEEIEAEERARREEAEKAMQYQHDQMQATAQEMAKAAAAEEVELVTGGQKVGRNDPCPCGSGKKYKQCHGKLV